MWRFSYVAWCVALLIGGDVTDAVAQDGEGVRARNVELQVAIVKAKAREQLTAAVDTWLSEVSSLARATSTTEARCRLNMFDAVHRAVLADVDRGAVQEGEGAGAEGALIALLEADMKRSVLFSEEKMERSERVARFRKELEEAVRADATDAHVKAARALALWSLREVAALPKEVVESDARRARYTLLANFMEWQLTQDLPEEGRREACNQVAVVEDAVIASLVGKGQAPTTEVASRLAALLQAAGENPAMKEGSEKRETQDVFVEYQKYVRGGRDKKEEEAYELLKKALVGGQAGGR